MAEKYEHIFLDNSKELLSKVSKPGGGSKWVVPERDRKTHSEKLLQQFSEIWEERKKQEDNRTSIGKPSREGTYLEFKSAANHDLVTKSLEDLRKGIRLLNVTENRIEDQATTHALVYIPRGKENHFIKKIEDYQKKNSRDSENPKNANLVNSIEDIRLSLLESLWTDNEKLIPSNKPKWCEVWLNTDNVEKVEGFKALLKRLKIEYKEGEIFFPERTVLLIFAQRKDLMELMLQSDLLAEFRAGQETAGFWLKETPAEQNEWLKELVGRLNIKSDTKLKICILDRGVNSGHPLLSPIISAQDTMTVNTSWGVYDHHGGSGHGTLMAGIAGYGELEFLLSNSDSIDINHKLCSVKIMPPSGQQSVSVEHWGYITIQGISIAEIQNPKDVIIYGMAVSSSTESDRGQPSSWSGAIDSLAFGDESATRLIIVSGGNVRDDSLWQSYPDSNLVTSIENPGQSWNALIVGAYTRKTVAKDQKFKTFAPIARSGELSPYSRTSSIWENKWPVKPDVVFEGGNLLKDSSGFITTQDDINLLSTSANFNQSPFDVFNGTSAATAQASWFAAQIASRYENAWMETVRGLMIHSAEWNDQMFKQFNYSDDKTDIGRLMRIFGYGIPNLDKAIYSVENSLSMIIQEEIQPFKLNGSRGTIADVHFFKLPWPDEVLLVLADLKVKLRVTLSYFIEPGPGKIGWKDKYRYPSHGLRFDRNFSGETEERFKKRINALAQEVEDDSANMKGERWIIGKNQRDFGSIHSDYWIGTAAELSTCNMFTVYPVTGWWKERTNLKKVETKTRYSLIISLETEQENVELYTTILNKVKVPIKINA